MLALRDMKFFHLVLSIILLILLSSCMSKEPKWSGLPYHTRIFEGTYDDVWLASLKSLGDYPLKVSNKDVGKVFTEIVNGPYNELVFTYPDPVELPERFRYSLRLNFAKFTDEDDQPLVRVRVMKTLEKYKNFYSGWMAYPSDGLEENILLYRIEQLLKIEQKVNKLLK